VALFLLVPVAAAAELRIPFDMVEDDEASISATCGAAEPGVSDPGGYLYTKTITNLTQIRLLLSQANSANKPFVWFKDEETASFVSPRSNAATDGIEDLTTEARALTFGASKLPTAPFPVGVDFAATFNNVDPLVDYFALPQPVAVAGSGDNAIHEWEVDLDLVDLTHGVDPCAITELKIAVRFVGEAKVSCLEGGGSPNASWGLVCDQPELVVETSTPILTCP
jgi:hypothetical protein